MKLIWLDNIILSKIGLIKKDKILDIILLIKSLKILKLLISKVNH